MAITEERPTTGECPRATSLKHYIQTTSLFTQARAALCICRLPCRHFTTQSTDFAPIEETLASALVGLSEYYTSNQLRANPTKTQVSLFHLRNRECGKQLNISWNSVNLTHCNLPVYLITYGEDKKKVGTRNNIIRKLRTSKWGATPLGQNPWAVLTKVDKTPHILFLNFFSPKDGVIYKQN